MSYWMLYDLFICHASEDKESFVRPLADALRAKHVEVWYDEFSLELGDSIRRSIDAGLRQSRFGVVVLSHAFFNKQWPQYELDGLTEIEMRGRDKVLLPIWHGVGHKEVTSQSPSLANRKAISSTGGIEPVVAAIMQVVRPQGSPLIAARDLLLEWGVTPPVITDPYWLEVTEASNQVNASGAVVPEKSTWGRWTFPLPPKEGGAQQWGERLAWSALQLNWSEAAEKQAITPLTRPEEVHEFVDSQPGLYETCEMFPRLLVEYAPQLVIPGMSGEFDALFSRLYEESLHRHKELRKRGDKGGTGLTIDGLGPLCDEEWALRDPHFGGYGADFIANDYFSGGIFGPPVSPYKHTDHMIWLLSEASGWLPEPVHQVLLAGMAGWGVWLWSDGDWPSRRALSRGLFDAEKGKHFRWSPKRRDDALNRFRVTTETLGLLETPDAILTRFIEYDFPGKWLAHRRETGERKQGSP